MSRPSQAAAASAAAQPVLNAALESMPFGFSMWDEEYGLLLWNSGYVKIYGFDPATLRIGMTLAEICELTVGLGNHPGMTPPELLAIYRDRLLATTHGASGRIYEKDIRGRRIKTSYQRVAGLGWAVTHEDVTAERRRETELRTQNARLDAALESMTYGFCIWGADLTLALWNQRFIDMYGLSAGAIRKGERLVDFFLASVEAGNHQGRLARELGDDYRGRLTALDIGKTLVTEEVLASGRVVKVSHTRTADLTWIATHEDITEQKDRINALQQSERELQLQNMRFEAAVDNMSQGLCMFDKHQKLVICNRRYADLYGLPQDLVLPGTSLAEILRNRIDRGLYPVDGPDSYIRRRVEMVDGGTEAVDTVELRDGRVIAVMHHPMNDGGWVSTHQDITEQRRTEARIRHLARHDALTDLPNRMVFRERMQAAEARIRRGEIAAVLCIDLDHFKSVNDALGHAVGDAVLRAVGDRLRSACREEDSVARLGGDEFAMLSGPLAHAEEAAALAARIVKAMAEPFVIDSHHVVIGASVGIAVAPSDGRDAETMIKNADLALYRAKAEGRGTYHFFEPGMDAALQQRLALAVGLRSAIANRELDLAYQPLFNFKDNRISCFEALLRWHHPERGTILPDVIVPIAEETGVIVQIGEWLLREACAVAATWPDLVRVAVNLSPIQFRNRNLTQHVVGALAAAGLKPDRLELEVTESVLLSDNEPALTILHQLREIGVRISLDDFGTGYSSLSYLRSFRFDKIKIDRSFVRDLATRDDSFAIVKAVIGLGKSLGISTTAEGVETEAQLDLVRAQGCTEVQGFFFSPPLPANAVVKLLAAHGLTEARARDQKAAS